MGIDRIGKGSGGVPIAGSEPPAAGENRQPAPRPDLTHDLRRVARESGGERYRLQGYGELSDAFARIADEPHHQYLLGFVPAVFDGKRHEIEVRVKRPGIAVRSRKSYVAVRIDRPVAGSEDAAAGRHA